MPKRPGGELASRPLHFVWIADCSGSMSINGKIDSLNDAIRESVVHMRDVAADNPYANVLVRAVSFSHGARWHIPDPIAIERFTWTDLIADPLQTTSAAADVIFLIDTSGSMGDEIDAVKQNCISFADEIIKRGASVRLGLIGFDIGGHRARGASSRGYAVRELSKYTIGVWPLATPASFQKNVQSLSVGLFGGMGCYLADMDTADIFPHVLKAFGDSEGRDRVLVIISDEIGSTDGLREITTQLRSGGITAHVLGVAGKQRAHEQISEQTGGQFWNIHRAKGKQSFHDILHNVAECIAKEVTQKLADGSTSAGTDTGQALSLVAQQLKIPPMSDRALPPVLVLISDGQPTDDFSRGLDALLGLPWGKKAVRLAIAIGDDADLGTLQRFIGEAEIKPLRANRPEALLQYIRWVSTAVLKAASSPVSQAKEGRTRSNVPLPLPVGTGAAFDENGVW